jgi:hypothetical protein
MVNPHIMVRDLKSAYPDDTWFHAFVESIDGPILSQLYNDIIVRGGKLVQTVREWNNIPETMGWNAPNFCTPHYKRGNP